MVVGIDLTTNITPRSGSGTVTDVSNLPYTLGAVWTDPKNGNKFRFILAEDVNIASGNSLRYTTDFNGYEVSADATSGTADAAFAAGIGVATITDGNCGWMQIAGRNTVAVVTDNNIAVDEQLKAHGSTDGGFDTSDVARSAEFGWATEADTGTALAAGTIYLDITQQ